MKHIPNILSCVRILMIPFFVWLLLTGRTRGAAALLAASGLSDVLDGYLARRFGWVSQLGKFLDPAADKLTQVTVCFTLAILLRQYWPLFAVLFAKELLMLLLGGYLMRQGARIEGAKWFGKLVTALFYVSMTLIVLAPSLPAWLITAMLSLTVAAALVAAAMYLPEFRRYVRQKK